MKCPRCQSIVEVEIECFFGYVSNMDNYRVGDEYKWFPRKAVQNGGRPEGGNIDGEGYTDCPLCKKDFFVKVIVRNDLIQVVEPDFDRPPYIPD